VIYTSHAELILDVQRAEKGVCATQFSRSEDFNRFQLCDGRQRRWHHSGVLEDPIYMSLCKYLYKDNATNLVPELISPSYVTNQAKVTAQMPTCKRKHFEIGLCGILVWYLGSNEAGACGLCQTRKQYGLCRSRKEDLAIFSGDLRLLAILFFLPHVLFGRLHYQTVHNSA